MRVEGHDLPLSEVEELRGNELAEEADRLVDRARALGPAGIALARAFDFLRDAWLRTGRAPPAFKGRSTWQLACDSETKTRNSDRAPESKRRPSHLNEVSMIQIVTACWFSKLNPDVYMRVGISRGTPRGIGGYRKYTRLNPGPWFARVSAAEYRARYFAEILEPLDPEAVVTDLLKLGDARVPALCCWEPSTGSAWCHRGFVSAWLHDTVGMTVFEAGHESDGYGWAHPKIPAPYRTREDNFFGL